MSRSDRYITAEVADLGTESKQTAARSAVLTRKGARTRETLPNLATPRPLYPPPLPRHLPPRYPPPRYLATPYLAPRYLATPYLSTSPPRYLSPSPLRAR